MILERTLPGDRTPEERLAATAELYARSAAKRDGQAARLQSAGLVHAARRYRALAEADRGTAARVRAKRAAYAALRTETEGGRT